MSLENDTLKQFVLSQSTISNTSDLLFSEHERVLGQVAIYLSKNEITTITELRKLIREFTSEPFQYELFNTEIAKFAKVQANQYASTISQYVTGITVAKLSKDKIDKVLKSMIINNDTLAGMQKTLTDKSKTFFKQEMTNAYINSATAQEINKELFSRLDNITKTLKQHSVTQTRTVLNGVSNGMASETYKDNSDILDGVQILTTLDNRTSPVCQFYGSTPEKVYPVDNHPILPAHYNCRSILIPAIKDEYELFEDNSTRPAKFYDKEGNLERIEKVSSKLSYDDWLRQQPKTFQKLHLGNTKYALFNKGIKFDKFVDGGRPLSVGELKDVLKNELSGK